MATSLAEQLQRLAVPQTSLLKKDKRKASLLFDPKEAAGLRKEIFYQIGLEGFEELCSKNQAFESFNNNLFSPISKNFDRVIEDKQANEKLNKSIDRLLLFLSPYFSLPCTHKILEFLVDRFMIHQFNRDSLILLSLPYHESNIFVRVIQICEFKEQNDPLYFLKSLQKPGLHLTKQTLLVHAASHPAFLKLVSNFTMKLAKIFENPNLLTVAFNFFNTVFTGTIEYSSEVTEDQVTQMVPALVAGLKSSIPDFTASCYVIIACLSAKTVLGDKLLNRLVELMSEVRCQTLKIEAVLALVILYQSQTHYTDIPKHAVVNLCKFEWISKSLNILLESGSNIESFLKVLIQKTVAVGVNDDSKTQQDFLRSLLNNIKLNDSFIPVFLRLFLDTLSPDMSNYSLEVKSWLKDILNMIETQYPTQFDLEIKNILNGKFSEIEHKRKVCLQQILKHTLKSKSTSNVFDKLYHPSEEMRKEGIKLVYKIHQNLNNSEQDLLTSALIDKLNDDNAKVVLESLKALRKMKCPYDKYSDELTRLVRKVRTGHEQWKEVGDLAILMMCLKREFSWVVFLDVFPFLLPRTLDELITAKNILQQPFFAQNEHLKALHHLTHLELCEKNIDIFARKAIYYSSDENKTPIENLVALVDSEPHLFANNQISQYCAILILSEALKNSKDFTSMIATLEICQKFYFESNKNCFDVKSSEWEYMKIAKRGLFPVKGILECASKMTMNTRINNVDFSQTKNRIFELCLSIFFKDTDKCESLVDAFLNTFQKLHRKIDFLLNASNLEFNSQYTQKFLKYVLEKFVGHKDFPKMKVSLNDKIFPYMICILLNTEKNVRKIVIKILKSFKNNSLNSNNEWLKFVNNLIDHEKELIMDENQAPIIISTLLQNEENCDVLMTLENLVNHKNCAIYIRSRLLFLIVHVNDASSLNSISNSVLEVLQKDNKGYSALACEKFISYIKDDVARSAIKNSNLYTFIQLCLNNNKLEVVLHAEVTNLRKMILSHFSNKNVLSSFPDVLHTLIDEFCEIYVDCNDPDCVALIMKIFKHVDLDAGLVVPLLEKMRDVQAVIKDNPEKKIKKQRKVMPTIAILDTLEWKKGVAILELIQNKKKIKNIENLVPVLFDILKKCLDFDEQSTVEYPKQLILATILLIVKKVENIPEKNFDVESIVQCVRSSQNPQTHHHAMLVLAHIAKLVPDEVLQHIMAIFTFVGSSLLRHDDAYSTQVISQVLDTTVPIFLEEDHKDKLVKVLSVFVDAFLDVPEHRRLALYKQLLNNINPNDNLYLFLVLVFDSYVMNCAKQKSAKGLENTNRLNIARNLCQEFAPEITLNSCIKIVEFIKVMPVESEDVKSFQNKHLLNFDNYSAKQLRHYRYTATTFVATLLSAEYFVNQIARLNNADLFNLEKIFKDLIISVLTCIQKTSKLSENYRNSPQTQYWKVVLHHSYDILDAVNELLPANMFLLVTKGLLVHNLMTVKRRALDLLNAKLHMNLIDSCDKSEVYASIPQVLSIIAELTKKESLDSDEEILVQTALLSLKLFVKCFAQKDPEKFVEILKFVTNLLSLDLTSSNILASVILCLAELCVDLRAHAVACLSEFMPSFLKVLKTQKHQETSNLLLLSVVTTIHKLVDSLPLFLSPYLGKILFEVSILISKFGTDTKDQKSISLVNKLTNLKDKIGSNIPLRVLIPTVSTSYENLVKKKAFHGINSLMDILIGAIKNSNQNDIISTLPDLTKFFLNALQFRTDNLTSIQITNDVEKSSIKALNSLVLKLSENIFRPFFYKLYDWAVRSAKPKSQRIITFYNIAQEIANSLKGLFVLFAGEFLKNAVDVLDALNKSKNEETYFGDENKDSVLLEHVLLTLKAICEYDNQKFLNKKRFDLMMQPLVDQLENDLGGLNDLTERNLRLVTPTILHFTLAIGEDSLWKQMNYQILLKMRSPVPEIRLVTLHCLTEVVVKLGEDFLPLLPETIPFLAELLEDEDEKVEQSCRKAVQEMEKVLGEPLQKYF